MSKNLRSALIAAAAQYGALALGCVLGCPWLPKIDRPPEPVARFLGWLLSPETLGISAGLAFLAEAIRHWISLRLWSAHPTTTWLCLGLLVYAASYLLGGPSLEPRDDSDFILAFLGLLPFLLAIGPLVRSGAWWGMAGAVVFYATALAIIISNGFTRLGGMGFFYRWVA